GICVQRERFASIDICGIGSKMSEQRRNLSKWEYLIFSIKRESSSLRKWPIAKSRTTLLATLAGVVILSIISITLIYAFLPGSPPSATINDENPHIAQLSTIAFSIAQFKSLASRQTPPSSDKSAIIKGIIEKLSNDATGFAFEVDNGEDAKIHQYANSAAAIAALDSLLQNVVGRNPNQTNAVAVYRRAMPNDQQIQHSYTLFAATPDDYASYEDFFNDMKTAVQELSALRDVHENVKAILVSTADMTNITGDSGIHVVTDVEGDNDHMVDVIANDIGKLLHYHRDSVLLLSVGEYHAFAIYHFRYRRTICVHIIAYFVGYFVSALLTFSLERKSPNYHAQA
uniref:Uncharacterized protein n=3 Tax=Parascaris univalens TaxID=6257 RepID=A0A915CII6_PARUN